MPHRSAPESTLPSALFLKLVLFFGIGVCEAQDAFEPREVLASDPNLTFLDGVVDPEFDGQGRFVWVDRDGNVWVGNVDPDTGLFDPPDGRAELVDVGAVTVGDIGNGPEWVYTSNGPQVLYSRYIGFTTAILKANLTSSGWDPRFLGQPLDRVAPVGSLDRQDATPLIAYRGPNSTTDPPKNNAQYVRDLNNPGTEQLIPTTEEFRVSAVRMVPNSQAVVFSRPMPEQEAPPRRQAFLYDVDTQQLEQLTSDTGSKTAVFMWEAPEYGGEKIFFTLVDEQFLRVYRKLDPDQDGVAEWTEIGIIDPPGLDFIWSPEPFVFRDKSYIVMVTSATDDQRSLTDPTEIWLADLDFGNPLYRRLSDDRELVRKDPEVYISRQGPFTYIQVGGDQNADINRLDMGLLPQR